MITYPAEGTDKILRAEHKRFVAGKPSRVLKGVLPMRCAHCGYTIVSIEDDGLIWYHFNDPPVRDGKFQLRIRCIVDGEPYAKVIRSRAEPYLLDEVFQ